MRVEINGPLVEGSFIKRVNRFIAEIEIEGKVELVHVANTGRMKELLIEGARVIVRKVDNENRKTKYDLVMAYKNNILVMIDSKIPNILLEGAFKRGILKAFPKYDYVKREVQYGSSRLDMVASNSEERVLIEAKCVTLVKENKVATFPDAPTARGTRHIYELIDAKEKGFRAVAFFIIQREDAVVFTPNNEMDENFANAVKCAFNKGVEFYSYICKVNTNEISLYKEIPVIIK